MRHKLTLQNGGRLDALLAEETGYSRELIKKLIAKGGIKIGGEKIRKPSQKAEAGATVYISGLTLSRIAKEEDACQKLLPEHIDFTVVYEDKDLLVVDKPAGLVVHPAHACPSGTLLNGVAYYLHISEKSDYLPKPINRIDRDTSGLVLIAKTEECHLKLSKQFEGRGVEKFYKAVVFGDFRDANCPSAFAEKYGAVFKKSEDGIVEYGTYLNRSKMDRRRVVVAEKGRWALSRFSGEKTKELSGCNETISALLIRILTGRTHQIRAQLKSLGFTVVGDPMYSNKRLSALSEKVFASLGQKTRMLLHAWRITLRLVDGKSMTFEAKIPREFTDVFEATC